MKRFLTGVVLLQLISSMSLQAYKVRTYTSETEFTEVSYEPSEQLLKLMEKLIQYRDKAKEDLHKNLVEKASPSKQEEISAWLAEGVQEYVQWAESSELVKSLAYYIMHDKSIISLLTDPCDINGLVVSAFNWRCGIYHEYNNNAFFKKMIDKIMYALCNGICPGCHHGTVGRDCVVDAQFGAYLLYEFLCTLVGKAIKKFNAHDVAIVAY